MSLEKEDENFRKRFMKTSMTLLVICIGCAIFIPIRAKEQTPKISSLTEIQWLKLENLAYKQELAQNMFQNAQNNFLSQLQATCKEYKMDKCKLDVQNKSIVEVK